MSFPKNLSLIFSAVCFGGLVKSACAWSFGTLGINAKLGVKMAPALTPLFLYQHLIWGGLWAFLFFLPVKGWSYYSKGVLYSLGMSAVQLLFIFPKMHAGLLGFKLGYLTPVLVVFFGIIWWVSTAFWLKLVRES